MAGNHSNVAGINQPEAVIILAAGAGTRMKSATPKVLHQIAGRSLLSHVAHAAAGVQPRHIVFVVGHEVGRIRDHISEYILPAIDIPVTIAHQTEQKGTGDAVKSALRELPSLEGTIIVLNGDAPLIKAETLLQLVKMQEGHAAAVLSALVPQPHGLGRILRSEDGALEAIVEERDASENERTIHEINSGAYAFDVGTLVPALNQIATHNDQKQEYLTDVIGLLRQNGASVSAYQAESWMETLGCNDRVELAKAGAVLRDRILEAHMRRGVSIEDPASVWIDTDVVIGADTVIAPGVQLRGSTRIGSNAYIGPDTTLLDTEAGDGVRIVRSHCVDARVEEGSEVGPYAYLRPGTHLADEVKIGAFVEVKNSDIHTKAKVPHLTYVGDASIGEGTNIGASSVFVNYDGEKKHRTTIGRYCRTGSDTMFVAPVTIGDGAYTAAGSVITENVPPGALAVARARQRNIEEWVLDKRPDSESAVKAREALKESL